VGAGEGKLTRRRDLTTPGLLGLPVAWLGVFFVAPIVIVALYSFDVYTLFPGPHGFTLDAWRAVAHDDTVGEVGLAADMGGNHQGNAARARRAG
jgi:ABC-type spermidine/putrescine transport system permease subunit II